MLALLLLLQGADGAGTYSGTAKQLDVHLPRIETQAKIDVVKQRLIKYFGYNETSATDVLNYVASIFARGDSKQDE